MYYYFDEKFSDLYDWIIEEGIASEETLQVVINLLGRKVEVLNDVIEVQTGYRSREQYEGEEYEDEDEDEDEE